MYNGNVYRFTSRHKGAWNASHVTASTVGTEINLVPGKISTAISDNNGNYYTKTETATQISTAITNNNGNYYTKTETATQISTYVGAHAYGLVSGITIDANGVDITGSKYVRIQAETNRKWIYNASGLTYQDTANNVGLFNIGVTSNFQNVQYRTGVFYDASNAANNDWKLYLAASSKYNNVLYSGGFCIKTEQYQYGRTVYLMPIESGTSKIILCGGYDAGSSTYNVNNAIYFAPSSRTKNKTFSIFYQGTDDTMWLQADSSVAGATYYTGTLVGSSSKYIKHNIKSLDETGELIDDLNPVSFVYDGDPDEKTHFGLIYEETENIIPEICVTNEVNNASNKAINYVEIIPLLIKEIQTLRNRINELNNGGN